MSDKTMLDETRQMGWPPDCPLSVAVAALIFVAISALVFW